MELIGECPIENAEKVGERLSYIMAHSIEEYTDMPFKCDSEVESKWYYNTYVHDIDSEISELKEKMSIDEIRDYMYNEHCECTKEEIDEIIQHDICA